MSTKLIVPAVAIAAAALLARLVYLRDEPESTLDRVTREGVIRVGYVEGPPFAERGPDGAVSGVSPAVARLVLHELGAPRLEWVRTELGSVIPELEAGRFDVVATGLSATPGRSRRVRFSVPTHASSSALVLRRDDGRALARLADVARDTGVRLGVLAGSAQVELAHAAGVPAARLLQLPTVATAIAALQTGRVDALGLVDPIARHVVAQGGSQALVAVPMADGTRRYGAFVFRRDDAELGEAFDRVLRGFVGSEAHRRLVVPLGLAPGEIPATLPGAFGALDPQDAPDGGDAPVEPSVRPPRASRIADVAR